MKESPRGHSTNTEAASSVEHHLPVCNSDLALHKDSDIFIQWTNQYNPNSDGTPYYLGVLEY
jgi:hypothetical protein